MKKLFVLFAVLGLTPSIVFAQSAPIHREATLGTILASTACTSSQTITLSDGQLTGYAYAIFHINHGTHGALSAVGMTCVDEAGGTLQDCDIANGVCTSNDASWTKALSTTKKWPWRVKILGFRSVVCTVTCTGANSTDRISATGDLVTQ